MAPGSGKRQIVWSQGQILPPEAALAVQLVEAEKAGTHFPIVISHDCDLAAAAEKEPHVEILIGRSIAKLGAASNAKIARRLELPLQAVRDQSALTRYKTTPCGGTTASMSPPDFFVSPVHRLSVE